MMNQITNAYYINALARKIQKALTKRLAFPSLEDSNRQKWVKIFQSQTKIT